MAGKAVPYDEMKEEAPEESDAGENEATEDPSDDDEFMMYAEKAGFTGEKAKNLWLAIARCQELVDKDDDDKAGALSLGGGEEA